MASGRVPNTSIIFFIFILLIFFFLALSFTERHFAHNIALQSHCYRRIFLTLTESPHYVARQCRNACGEEGQTVMRHIAQIQSDVGAHEQ